MSLDAPESEKDRDVLRRWPLAVTIYDLLRSAPKEWSLRIAVYGRWGEGKTTVLKFIEQLAVKDGVKTIWFNPWGAQGRDELWDRFASAVSAAAEPGRRFGLKASVRSGISWMQKWGSEAAQASKITQALLGILGQAKKQLGANPEDVETLLFALGDSKLVVFIDDLDRARPDLVPHLLLSLRELLELPRCAFILALDPGVVAKALPSVHPGWGTTSEFLEKFIDYPFWVPGVDKEACLALARTQLTIGSHRIDEKALEDIADLLPLNPRQAKLFFRKLWRLKNILERHNREELDWTIILILELIRDAAVKTAEDLLNKKDFIEDLLRSYWAGQLLPKDETQGFGEDKWINALRSTAVRYQEADDTVLTRLVTLFNAIRTRTSLVAKNNFEYWVRLLEDPPGLTWKEYRGLMDRWQTNQTGELLRELVHEHAGKIEAPSKRVCADLLGSLIQDRQMRLERAADSDTHDELAQEMQMAELPAACLHRLVIDLRIFSGGDIGIGFTEYQILYKHCLSWAHFTNDELYVKAREVERGLVMQAAKDGKTFAANALEALQIWMPPRAIEAQPAELAKRVIDEMLPVIYEELLDRFKRKDGITALWPTELFLVQRAVLFDKSLRFYSPERIESLRSIAVVALRDEAVQINFLEYIRLLGHGISRMLSPLTIDDLLPLVRDTEVLGLAWKAATCRRLQPRVIGSLKDTRQFLIAPAGSEDHLPLPLWWPEESTPANLPIAVSPPAPDQPLG